MNYQLLANGFPAVSIAKENRLDYFNALEVYTVEGNLVPFAEMVADLTDQPVSYTHLHPILPIGYIKHSNPMFKKKIINKFTAEGRTEIHKQLENINMGVLHYLMLNPDMGKSIEYNDNRLSLYSACLLYTSVVMC